VLQLRYDDPASADHPHHARYATIVPGAPGRCPACDAFGRVDSEDVVERRWQNQRCLECRCRWQYWFDEDGRIVEVREIAPARPADPEVLDLRDRRSPRLDAVLDLRTPARRVEDRGPGAAEVAAAPGAGG